METEDFHPSIGKRKYMEWKFSKRHTDQNLEMAIGGTYNTFMVVKIGC